MKFVSETNKLGFSFNKEKGEFLLSDWSKIATFAEKHLQEWEDSFELKLEDEARLLKNGQRELSWEIEARCKDENSMVLVKACKLDLTGWEDKVFVRFPKPERELPSSGGMDCKA